MKTPAKRPPVGSGKTLLIVPDIFDTMGGISRLMRIYLKALCEYAERDNGKVNLIALNDALLDSRDQQKYSNGRLDNWTVCGRKKKRFIKATLFQASGCDRIVCGHIAQLPVAWIAKLLNPGLEYYVIAHGIEAWRPFTFLERRALKGARRVISVSDYTRRELLKHCTLKPGRAVVLPNGLDPYFELERNPLPAPPSPVVLCISRLTKEDNYKGVNTLISAMVHVRKEIPDAQLRICGRGDNIRYLQEFANSLGLLNNGIVFLGFVDDSALVTEIRGSRVFALPSQKEGFGLVYLEAMAQGRPCIGALAGGAPEVITPESGLLVPFGDVEALAKATIDALRKDWSPSAIVERAAHFSYDRFKERLAGALA